MANLIHLFLSIPTRVQSVRNIDHHGVLFANVAVGMYDSRRHGDKSWIFSTDLQNLVGFRFAFAILPKMELICPIEEEEAIRLVMVLVRAAGDTGLRDAEITHRRGKTFGKAIHSEQLDEPTPCVLVSRDRFHDNTFHHCGGKRVPLG